MLEAVKNLYNNTLFRIDDNIARHSFGREHNCAV